MRRYSMYQYVRSERRPCCYNGCCLILLRLSIHNALPRSSNAADVPKRCCRRRVSVYENPLPQEVKPRGYLQKRYITIPVTLVYFEVHSPSDFTLFASGSISLIPARCL